MAFLTISTAAFAMPVALNSVRADVIEIGDQGRTFNGNLRQTIRRRAMKWSGKTTPLTLADASSYEAKLHSSTQPITAAGDLLSTASTGGVADVFARIVSKEYVASSTALRVVLNWELETPGSS